WSPTVHKTWQCNYFSKYKLLNTFSHQAMKKMFWLDLDFKAVFKNFCLFNV
ncbi:unnamed protein product, partial [Staurois parvus]